MQELTENRETPQVPHSKRAKTNGSGHKSKPEPKTEPKTETTDHAFPEASTLPDDDSAFDKPLEVPQSPSSVSEDFDSDIESALSDTKEEAQILVDTGIEIVKVVDKPKNFVYVYPTLMHGWVWLQEFDDPTKRPTYLVHPKLAKPYSPPCRQVQFAICVEPLPEDAVWPTYIVWPIKQESPNTGEMSEYMESAMAKIRKALADPGWYRFAVPKGQRAYSLYRPNVPIKQEPKWPGPQNIGKAKSVAVFLLTKGFENRYINNVDHPMYAKLQNARGTKVE
jgi:hypothetical protein